MKMLSKNAHISYEDTRLLMYQIKKTYFLLFYMKLALLVHIKYSIFNTNKLMLSSPFTLFLTSFNLGDDFFMQTAEKQYCDELSQSIEFFGHLLKPYFRKMDNKSLETLLLISMAISLGAANIYQVIKLFGLPKTMTYNRIKGVSLYYWHQLLQHRLYEIALPLLKERIQKSKATQSRDGLILAVDDSVIARICTELGYVWKWWSGQLKRVTEGQNVIALILVIGDIILPLDVRIVSKQGQGLKTKPQIYAQMLEVAKSKLSQAGIDVSALKTTGDAAYLSEEIAQICQMEQATDTSQDESQSTFTGIFRGKDNYVFIIDGLRQKAGQWRSDFKEKLEEGWGTDGQPVYRTEAFSDKFGSVTLIFYIPKGKRAVSYLVVVGLPLRSCEALHDYSFHHRIEEFWKLLKGTLHLDSMKLQERHGAHACVCLKIIGYLILNMMKQNLRKLRTFRKVTINQLVELCPAFIDIKSIFKEHFHGIIPNNYYLNNALA